MEALSFLQAINPVELDDSLSPGQGWEHQLRYEIRQSEDGRIRGGDVKEKREAVSVKKDQLKKWVAT